MVNQPIHSAKATAPAKTTRGRRIPLMVKFQQRYEKRHGNYAAGR
jgi:hypothetical protein